MATTGNGTYVDETAEQWGYRHHTSPEIVLAIFELNKNPEQTWDDPTPAEEKTVMDRAWALADREEDVLYWGAETMHRRA